MNDNHDIHHEHDHHGEDEIDLRDLVRAVWDTRVPVAILLLVFAGVFWLVAALSGAREGVTYTWDTQIQFTFSGVSEGQYPDGSPFSSADLLSPVVLRRVYDANELEEYGLSRAEFADGLAIAPHAPNRRFVVQRFRNRLEDGDLSSAEIQELEGEFSQALERASRGQAQLTLTLRDSVLPTRSILSEEVARKVLLDIPRVWAEYMTADAGVFATDISLYSIDVLDSSILQTMDFLVAYDVLKDKFGLLNHNIESLEELPNSGNIRDPETDFRLSDIRALATELEEFVLEDTLSPTLAMGVSRNPDLTIRFFENRIDDLERRRDLMETRAERVEQALSDYTASPQQIGARLPGGSSLPEGMRSGSTTIPQFGSDFLDRLVQLGTDSGDVQFRQDLSRERLDYTLQAAELDAEATRLTRLIELIESESGDGASGDEIADEMAGELGSQLEEIISSLRNLFAATERIAERMNELRYGSQEAIYNISKAPEDPGTSAMVFTRANLQWFLLGCFLVIILGVMGVFLVNMVRQREDGDEAA